MGDWAGIRLLVYRVAKRVFDVAASGAGLALLSPLLLGLAAAIRFESPGPLIFRQKRLGMDGMEFEILKFRSMSQGAGVKLESPYQVYSAPDDPRITSVGRFIRKISLDELPQLVNVLLGDMSIVGPRPDLPTAINLYNEFERKKLEVKPGITGLSQVSGRNLLSSKEKWYLDATYVKRASLLYDIWIILKTVSIVMNKKGIYADPGADDA